MVATGLPSSTSAVNANIRSRRRRVISGSSARSPPDAELRGIGEDRLSRLLALPVDALEVLEREVDLAPHLHQRRVRRVP